MEQEIPSNKLTVYRVKQEFIGHELSNNAKLLKQINDDVAIYYDGSNPRQPKYLKRFFRLSNEEAKVFYTASPKIIALVKIPRSSEELVFSFGTGRFLLNPDAVDDRFGLRTALNIVNSDEIKNFSKTVLEANPKSTKEQLAKTANADEFGISSEQDLIKGLTGKVKSTWSDKLGETVSGSESLILRLPCNIDNVGIIAEHILEAYKSEEYKKDFDWVDQIKAVKNKDIVRQLNDKLIQNLSGLDENGYTKVWAAVPDYLEYEEVYEFKIGGTKQAKTYSDIEKQYVIDAIGENLTIEALKKLKIFAISSKDDLTVLEQWNSFRCLYAEVNNGESVFLLIDGKWYEIASDFCDDVKVDYDRISTRRGELMDYNHDREASYNIALARAISGQCYDCKTVVYGGGHSKIEVCDVQTDEGDLIHVKLYTGSAALSHLFNQGYVSGELIRNDPNFILKANKDTGGDFTKSPANRKKKIIFAIVTSKPDKFDMPFFSKVTLRSVVRQLNGLGYDVEIQLVRNIRGEATKGV